MTTRIVVCGAAGRMGKAILRIAKETPGVEIAGAVEAMAHPQMGQDAGTVAGIGSIGVALSPSLGDVATPGCVLIDFTGPESSLANLRLANERSLGIVIGSTGFSAEQRAELDRLASQGKTLISSNMSVGVAVLRRLAREAAAALGSSFDIEIVEMHHRMKVDAPSGTALTLAETVATAAGRNLHQDGIYGREGQVGKRKTGEIGVLALRGGDVIGDHTVIFAGEGERLELTHRAQSRDCLASGAVRAALWLAQQKPGRYDISDTLGDQAPST